MCKHWEDLFHGLELNSGESREQEFLVQCVNPELFQRTLANTFAENRQRKATEKQDEIPADELNVMQYACGFVPFKLIKKYKTNSGGKAGLFLDCLRNMAVMSEDHNPFLYQILV